jgi:hypothetical protein
MSKIPSDHWLFKPTLTEPEPAAQDSRLPPALDAPMPQPMTTAATAPNMTLPPVLLYGDEGWIIGYWCERGWYDIDGPAVRPTAWAPLPPPPALLLR